jgi:cyclic pyranopterin phosphate synthase
MAEMVDVGHKDIVPRAATASGFIRLQRETVEAIAQGRVEKGDVIQAATLAAIHGAKRAFELIPLCHPLRLDSVKPEVLLEEEGVTVRCTVAARERTGVEMEALMAVTLGLLTVWDMVKALEKDEGGQYPLTRITGVRVEEKRVERGAGGA